jgi:hypothetical protein
VQRILKHPAAAEQLTPINQGSWISESNELRRAGGTGVAWRAVGGGTEKRQCSECAAAIVGWSWTGATLARSKGESRPAGLVGKKQGRALGGEVDAEAWCLVGVSGGIHSVIVLVTVDAWENQRQSCSGNWRSASDGWIWSHTRRQRNSLRGGRGSPVTRGIWSAPIAVSSVPALPTALEGRHCLG